MYAKCFPRAIPTYSEKKEESQELVSSQSWAGRAFSILPVPIGLRVHFSVFYDSSKSKFRAHFLLYEKNNTTPIELEESFKTEGSSVRIVIKKQEDLEGCDLKTLTCACGYILQVLYPSKEQ